MSDTDEIGMYIPGMIHLLTIGPFLYKQRQNAFSYLDRHLYSVTQKRMQLRCDIPGEQDLAAQFPVQFKNRTYGWLAVFPDAVCPELPALPLDVALLFARVCGWLLYTAEISLLQEQHKEHIHAQCAQLTRSEKHILQLLCEHYNQQHIMEQLCISQATFLKHKYNIYKKLGVHCEHELIAVAFQVGIFMPLQTKPVL